VRDEDYSRTLTVPDEDYSRTSSYLMKIISGIMFIRYGQGSGIIFITHDEVLE
jgi:hypothetical protein